MTAFDNSNLGPEHQKAIEDLSGEINFPAEQLNSIYATALQSLQSGARIKDYLIVLASGKARSVVRAIRRSREP